MNSDNASSSAVCKGADNLAALLESANNPGLDLLQRFKAFARLFSSHKRRAKELTLLAAARSVAAGGMGDPTWVSAAAGEWAVQVGEYLALFDAADFMADPRITAQDYTTLLRTFLMEHGAVLRRSFIDGLPLGLGDEANAVRLLLETWCPNHDKCLSWLLGEERQSERPLTRPVKAAISAINQSAEVSGAVKTTWGR